MANGQFISLDVLSIRLGIPRAWLKSEADASRIPHLVIGRRRFFDPEAVRRTLAERSERVVTAQ